MPVDALKLMLPAQEKWAPAPFFRQLAELEGIPVINVHLWFDRKLQPYDGAGLCVSIYSIARHAHTSTRTHDTLFGHAVQRIHTRIWSSVHSRPRGGGPVVHSMHTHTCTGTRHVFALDLCIYIYKRRCCSTEARIPVRFFSLVVKE